MAIENFRHNGLERLFPRDDLRGVPPALAAKIRRVLFALAQANEISERHEPRALARFLTNGLQGLRVLSRCCVDVDILQDVVDVTLSVLDEPALSSLTGKQRTERRPA